jgi:hypothetical protein
MKKVRAGSTYRYEPVWLDKLDPPHGRPEVGTLLTVVKLHGCPPPNTMGHCHVNFPNGDFAGLVSVHSLVKP